MLMAFVHGAFIPIAALVLFRLIRDFIRAFPAASLFILVIIMLGIGVPILGSLGR